MSKKRFKKGAASLKKVIAIHKDEKLQKALHEGKGELASYYEKEIKRLEAELAKKEVKALPRSKRLKYQKK